MEKLKKALEKARDQLEFGYWFAGGYEDMEECVRLLEEGIAELQQPLKFTITMAPGHEPMIFGVHRVEGN